MGIIGAAVFVLLMLVIAVCAMMISTSNELTEAIQNINFGKVKFIGPTSSHFGRAPVPKNGMTKNRKDWGIH